MTTLLIVDLETSGTDPERDHVIEVGAVLFDCELGVPVAVKSALVRAESNEAEAVNGIPAASLSGPWCIAPEHVRPMLSGMAKLAGDEPPIFVAHNAAFDRQWLPGLGTQWICTFQDATWPRVPGETGSLINIALAYGVGVTRAHRAIEDCLLLAAVLGRVHGLEGGLDAWLARALEPKVEVIGAQPREQNDAAKQAGFRWDPERKVWRRLVRESQLAGFIEALPFAVRPVQTAEAAE